MRGNYQVIELTKENEHKYLAGVVELEKDVLNKMEEEGKNGQLFITGKEGIQEYIESPTNHVMVAVASDDESKTISAAYITKGQIDFTYNDITKYFKCNTGFQEYVKSKYSDKEYKTALREVYIEKICAYKYARDIILNEQSTDYMLGLSEEDKNSMFLNLVEDEYNNPENQFHEKSEIRDNLNKYMSLYMRLVKHDLERYLDFYWVDLDFLKDNLGSSIDTRRSEYDSTIQTYDTILKYQKYKIHDSSNCPNISKYYKANTSNTIELDTYITNPQNREKGIARILVFEGLKKSLYEISESNRNDEVFLVSTLHKDNYSSKYVSEFFGLKDYLFVNRRNGRDRQVHIYGMKKEEIPEYINQMEKKIAVLYDYNPNNIQISEQEKISIVEQQLKYEIEELDRLKTYKKDGEVKKYSGYIKCKQNKIESLTKLKQKYKNTQKINKVTGTNSGIIGNIANNFTVDFEPEL